MFPAFCWHDLPGPIKACDYHINAFHSPPPVDGFSLLPHVPLLHLVISDRFRDTGAGQGTPKSATYCLHILSEGKASLCTDLSIPSVPVQVRALTALHPEGTAKPWSPWGLPGIAGSSDTQYFMSLFHREANLMCMLPFFPIFIIGEKFCANCHHWVSAPCSPNTKVH